MSRTASVQSLDDSEDVSPITVDAIGNMLTYNGATFTWLGRRLQGITDEYNNISYSYDMDGRRVGKSVTSEDYSADYTYYYNGDILAGFDMTLDEGAGPLSYRMIFMYDESGEPFGFNCNGEDYYYVRNAQNDIYLIVDSNGYAQVYYQYDSWGRIIGGVDATDDNIAAINPYTYRGYYYDFETGFYYLKSRYYNPEFHRFINADAYMQTGQGMLDKNMFAYCGNNPVNIVDPAGQSWKDIKNWVSKKWNSAKKSLENTWDSLKKKVTNTFKKLPYDTAHEAATALGKKLNNLTQQDNNEYGQGIIYNRITNTYGLTNIVQGEHSSVSFGSIINNNENLVAVVHSHPYCNGHDGNNFSNIIINDNGITYGDWAVAESQKINVYLAAPNGNLYVMYWDNGEYNQNFVCDGLPIDDSRMNCR